MRAAFAILLQPCVGIGHGTDPRIGDFGVILESTKRINLR
jgi:hypothetical protein